MWTLYRWTIISPEDGPASIKPYHHTPKLCVSSKITAKIESWVYATQTDWERRNDKQSFDVYFLNGSLKLICIHRALKVLME